MVEHVIILAGGSGTRLWPASTSAMPKQFLDPGTGRSLLQMTVERAAAVAPRANIIIVTHTSQVPEVLAQCLDLVHLRGRLVILPEPGMRNTAPALALAATWLQDSGARDESTLVLASDHLITPVEALAADVEKADQLAREGYLVVFGIEPTRPETGYGYIEGGATHGPGRLVVGFREKPDQETAERYLQAGNFSWNSGMFVFRTDIFLEELARYEPAITTTFGAVRELPYERRRADLPVATHEGISVAWQSGFLNQLYTDLPRTSVDYAVMERSERVAMVEASFRWNDVGSWDEMAQLTEEGLVGSAGGNSCTVNGSAAAPLYSVDSRGNYLYADQPVVLCGVEDLVVVVRNGRVLVSRRGHSQHVREAITRMREDGREDLT